MAEPRYFAVSVFLPTFSFLAFFSEILMVTLPLLFRVPVPRSLVPK